MKLPGHALRARCLATLCAFTALLSPAAQAQDARTPGASIPAEDFFRLPQYGRAQLSPDGRYLAVVASPAGRRTQLTVIDLQNLGNSRVLVGMDDSDIHRVQWVNNQRLVFDVAQLQEATDKPIAHGLWAVDVDGGQFKQLINASSSVPKVNMEGIAELKNSLIKERREELLPWNWQLLRVLDDGSDDVIVEHHSFDGLGEFRSASVARLDTRNGRKRQILDQAPDNVYDWLLDGQGRAVAATAIAKDQYTMHLAGADGKTWTPWRSGNRFDAKDAFWFDVGPKGDLFLIGPAPDGRGDNKVLLRFDPKQAATPPQVLLNIKGYDFSGELVFDPQTGALLGVHYEGESLDSVWFDAGMKALQAEVDKALGATVNRIYCRDCLHSNVVLVQSNSDRQPTVFSLYQRDSKQLKPLMLARPWIKTEAMAAREPLRIAARDGLSLPITVTRPKSTAKQALPTVVLVHGGPFVRGNHWEWSDTAQFLASRGYLVIEPDFRGSAGYGSGHLRAGWKQWGLAMQDDLADATQWAIAKGLADPKRICIAGASYGGYAAMMGLIKNPELFRCGINWVGVSDLKLVFSSLNSDQGALGLSYDLPLMIGDPLKDGKRLDSTSPLKQAARLKQPLLMAYGAADRRVPMEHGVKMRDALATAGNQQVEWVLYPQEGHGWRAIETQKDFWGRVERFLQRHIGAAAH